MEKDEEEEDDDDDDEDEDEDGRKINTMLLDFNLVFLFN